MANSQQCPKCALKIDYVLTENRVYDKTLTFPSFENGF